MSSIKQTFDELVKGHDPILVYYRNAVKHWEEILPKARPLNAAAVTQLLNGKDLWFEQNCGGKYLGLEIMAVTGIGRFYDASNGFVQEGRASATIVANAMMQLPGAPELQGYARDVADFYELQDAS